MTQVFKRIHIYLLSILLFLTTVFANCQYSKPIFKHKKAGLSDNTVQEILQDTDGFMWFGTTSGLNKFDGINIYEYQNNFNDSSTISHSNVSVLFQDSKGNIWIGTSSGLNRFLPEANSFKQYFNSNKEFDSYLVNTIYDVIEDKLGNIIVASGAGLYIIDTAKNEYRNLSYNNIDITFYNYTITSIYDDNSGYLWTGTQTGKIFKTDQKTGESKEILITDNLGDSIYIEGINEFHSDINSNLWICANNSLLCIDKENTLQQHYNSNNPPFNTNRIVSISFDEKDNLWIGTENEGLFILNPYSKEIDNYKNVSGNINSLSSNSIRKIYRDSDNRMWVGTFHTGVDFYDKDIKKFKSYSKFNDSDKSLSNNSITAFIEDKNENIWIATDGGGVNYFNRKAETFTKYQHNSKNKNSLSKNAALCFHIDQEENVWIGTWSGGVNIFNPKTKKFTVWNEENYLNSNNIFSILEDNRGNVFMASYGGGINIWHRKNNTFSYITTDNYGSKGLLSNNLFILFLDSKNRLWVGTDNDGLNLIEFDDDFNFKIKTFITNTNDLYSLSDNTIFAIYEDKDSVMWFGTPDGLDKYNEVDSTFKTYRVNEGLPHNKVVGILNDDENNLWISTLNGLAKFNPYTDKFVVFGINDGLPDEKFNIRAAYYKNKRNELFFGTNNGFVIIDPENIKFSKSFPRTYLTEFKLFNIPVEIKTKNSVLSKHISQTKQIVLSYKESSFSFEYIGLNFSQPDKVQYAYMLEGFDDTWKFVGNQRQANYTNISPGEYIFKLKASNNGTDWNDYTTAIKITITPPFWKTFWFRFLISILIISIIIWFVLKKYIQLRRNNRILEKLVDKRTKEIQEKNIQLEEQALHLNEVNTVLEERQQYIEEQSEELKATNEELEQQTFQLNKANKILKERQGFIEKQSEEIKAKNKQLNQSNEKLSELVTMKDKFFSIIAHDLKNPFNILIGYTELLQMKYNNWNDDKRIKSVNTIHKSSIQLYKLLENLLVWSRSQRGLIKIERQNILVQDLLKDVFDSTESLARNKNIKIQTLVTPKDLAILTDKQMILTIIRNLVTNAIKFTKHGGEILISFIATDIEIVIAVKDNGVGMSDSVSKSLFKLDSNSTAVGTNNETGTGLGLILCKEFIDKLNGTIKVESELEVGSVFTICFPKEQYSTKS